MIGFELIGHRRWLAAAWLSAVSTFAHSQTPPAGALTGGRQEQRVDQQRQAEAREAVINAPSVRSALPEHPEYPVLPDESPCFPIQAIALSVPESLPAATQKAGASALPLDPFAFAARWLDHYAGQCLGQQGIRVIMAGLEQAILARGYVTTRAALPEQDLTGGTLHISLVPGMLSEIHAPSDTPWRAAFPAREGDLLVLRDLEQGLEQMKRLASQDVTMQIVPAGQPGESDVVLDVRRTKPWTALAAIDNAGARDTGKLQGSLSVALDNPLGLNDTLSVGATHDLSLGDKRFGSGGWSAAYSVPWGYWSASVAAYANDYRQQIAGINSTFVSSGRSQNLDLKLSRVIDRDQSHVIALQARLGKRFGSSFIDDTEIGLQHRNNTVLDFGITTRNFWATSQFDGSLVYRQGISGLGATDERTAPGLPTYRFGMAVLDANLLLPVGALPLRYATTLHGQYTNDVLHYVDDLAIGGRYTVRGFDGESMLASETGFFWRNELQWAVRGAGLTVFAGIDYGHVYGPNTRYLAGTELAGAVIGVRGAQKMAFGTLSGECFVGRPLYKPASFSTSRTTVGFSLSLAL